LTPLIPDDLVRKNVKRKKKPCRKPENGGMEFEKAKSHVVAS
jgi:hypothetical protein